MTGKFKMYIRSGGLDHNYVCKEGRSEKKNMYVRRWGLARYLYIKNRSENHKYVCKERGPTRNYKMGEKMYVCQTIFLSPPYSF